MSATPSVAKRILRKLVERLAAINGTGDFTHDLTGNVYRCRPRVQLTNDVVATGNPIAFVYRRAGGDERSRLSSSHEGQRVTITYDVVAFVPANMAADAEAGDAAEDLLADVERAIELPDDVFIRDDDVGANLLIAELALTGAEWEPADAGSQVDFIAVGVVVTYPHTYGKPEHVEA